MGKHTSHDERTTIDTENNLIVIDGRRFSLEYSTPSHGADNCAALYTVEDFPQITGELRYDEDPQICDPRDADNGTILASFGYAVSDYELGDEQWSADQHGDDFEVSCERCGGCGEDPERFELANDTMSVSEVIAAGTESSMESELAIRQKNDLDHRYYIRPAECSACNGDGYRNVDVIEYVKKVHDAVVALPVYFNSGRGADYGWCRIDEPVDDATNGVIYITKDAFEKEWANDREQALESMRSQVNEYSKYMQGECYFSLIEDELTDTSDSLSGLLGNECAEESLFWSLAEQIEAHIKEVNERAEMAARDIITV